MYIDEMTSLDIAGTRERRSGVGLRAVASLRLLVEQLESLQVDRARQLGWSWSQIANELAYPNRPRIKARRGRLDKKE